MTRPSLFLCLFGCLLATACAQPMPKTRPMPPVGKAPPLVVDSADVVRKGDIPPMAPKLKVALLLPMSGESVAVGNAMFDATTMALYDSYMAAPSTQIRTQIILIPKDSGNTPADAARSAKAAIDQGATFIVGPLFSQSVAQVEPIAKEKGITMLTFSNNRSVARSGIFTFGFLPEQQIARMAEYAFLNKYGRIAVLAPNDAYGEKIKDTLTDVYAKKGGAVSAGELYAPSPANIDAAVSRIASVYNSVPEERRFQAIFIADGGYQLKNIIKSLKKTNIDMKKIKLLGTGLWDDPEVMKIPEMEGAWFPSSPPEPYRIFENRFTATYGYKPVRLASLAYDALTLVATLGMSSPQADVNVAAMTDPRGYISPANGLFRLNPDGTSERKLAILEVTPNGFKILDQALKQFSDLDKPRVEAPPADGSAPAAPAASPAEPQAGPKVSSGF
jgi:ABC-type branched-subunit amino acid transport system substrate-binding protein